MQRRWMVGVAFTILSLGVLAGDGIPMGNAVFYPSVEATYTHTDNLYLQDASMPEGGVSDSFWLVRPKLGFEFPFKQSYLRLDLAYQYKDYQDFRLSEHNTYDVNLLGNFAFGPGLKLKIQEEFTQGVQETRKFDPGYEQYFGNDKFHANNLRVGLEFPMGRLDSLEVYGLYDKVSFSGGSNPNDNRPFYDFWSAGGGFTWRHKYNPTSAWLLDASYVTTKPQKQAADVNLRTTLDKKNHAYKIMAGWEGAWSQYFGGYAKAGYERMNYTQNGYGDFSGVSVDAGLGFTPSEFLKVNLDLFRSPYQSVYNVNNYYTATGANLLVHYEFSRFLFFSAGYKYQENKYPDAVVADVFGTGTPTSPEFLQTAGQVRRDKIGTLIGEVGYHLSKQFSLKANYQYEDRNSNIHYFNLWEIKPYSYKENRFMVQAQIGW